MSKPLSMKKFPPSPRPALVTFLLLLLLYLPLGAWADKDFVMVTPAGDIELDPHHAYTTTEAQIFSALYEGLVTYHPATLEPLPGAAESWEVSEEGRVYTFTLRSGLQFHNGDPLTAADFRETWLRIMNPEERAEYASLLDVIQNAEPYRRGEITDPAQVGLAVRDERTLVVTLEQPAPHFLRILCHHSFSPLHKDYRTGRIPFRREDFIGNGPYRLAETTEEEIILKAAETYWEAEEVKLKTLRLLFPQSRQETTRLFNEDQVEWVTSGIDFSNLTRPEAFEVTPLFATYYYYFSNKESPWADPRVRRALAALLPWKDIRKEQLIPGDSLIPDIPYYPAAEKREDISSQEALALLDEAGFPEGRGLPAPVIAIPEGVEDRRISGLMKEAWEAQLPQLSREVTIRIYPYSQYYDALRTETYTLGTISWIGDFADPLTFLQMWTRDSNLNDSGYRNPAYDELVKEASGKTIPERYEMMSQAETLLLQNAQVLPVGHTPAFNLIDLRYIGGWFPNVLDIHPFKHLRHLSTLPIPGVVQAQPGAAVN